MRTVQQKISERGVYTPAAALVGKFLFSLPFGRGGTHLLEEQFTEVRGSVKADHAAIKIVFLPFQSFPFIIVDC